MRGGDHDAYGVLVRRHGAVALRAAVALGAGADADDVVQESFVKAYRALGGFRPGSPFRPWLLAIVTNETRNLHRGRARRADRERRSPADVPTDEVADPADQAIGRERGALLHRELAGLSGRYREVLVCRYLLELSERETATMLGLSPGTVKSRTSRALRRLRDQLETTAGRSASGSEEVHRGS